MKDKDTGGPRAGTGPLWLRLDNRRVAQVDALARKFGKSRAAMLQWLVLRSLDELLVPTTAPHPGNDQPAATA